MASGEKAKGKEKITNKGWQMVVAKRRNRLPVTPATHAESPQRGMQTRTTRATTPTDRGPPEGHQVPAGESPLDEALDIKNSGEFSPRSSKGPPAGHQDPAGRAPRRPRGKPGSPTAGGPRLCPGSWRATAGTRPTPRRPMRALTAPHAREQPRRNASGSREGAPGPLRPSKAGEADHGPGQQRPNKSPTPPTGQCRGQGIGEGHGNTPHGRRMSPLSNGKRGGKRME